MIAKPLGVDRGRQGVQQRLIRLQVRQHIQRRQHAQQQFRAVSYVHDAVQVRQDGHVTQVLPQPGQRQHTGMAMGIADALGDLVAHGVGGGGAADADGSAGLVCCLQHGVRRSGVACQVCLDIPQYALDRLFRMDAALRCGLCGPVGLNALAQRIQRTGFFVIQRQRIQKGAVQQDRLRQQRRMIQGELVAVDINHRDRRGLRPSSRRGGHSNVGQIACRKPARTHRIHVPRQQQRLDGLGGIHRRSAANGNQPVTVPLSIERCTVLRVCQVRIGMIAGEHGHIQSNAAEDLRLHALAAHQQRPMHIHIRHNPGQLSAGKAVPASDDKLLHAFDSPRCFSPLLYRIHAVLSNRNHHCSTRHPTRRF